MSLCEVCESPCAKYRCPGCGLRTCSLACVKRHKTGHHCDGKRKKTSFVSLSEFTDRHLLSDYHFLEDVSRVVDSSCRDKSWRERDWRRRGRTRKESSRLQRLARKHSTELLFCPSGMTRHNANTSCVTGTSSHSVIKWKVELTFTLKDLHYEDNVVETELLANVLENYLHKDPITKHCLQGYTEERGVENVEVGGVESVEVLMRVEREPRASPRYYLLDKELSFQDNFVGKTILEFPSLLVIPHSHLTRYVLHPSSVCPTLSPTPSDPHPPSTPGMLGSLQLIAEQYSDSDE